VDGQNGSEEFGLSRDDLGMPGADAADKAWMKMIREKIEAVIEKKNMRWYYEE